MKRNGKNMKMPKDGVMTSDLWSQLSNTDRYEYMKTDYISNLQALKDAKKKAKEAKQQA